MHHCQGVDAVDRDKTSPSLRLVTDPSVIYRYGYILVVINVMNAITSQLEMHINANKKYVSACAVDNWLVMN